jgi:hypothetical protein
MSLLQSKEWLNTAQTPRLCMYSWWTFTTESVTSQLTASPFLQQSPCYNGISDETTDSQSLLTAEPLLQRNQWRDNWQPVPSYSGAPATTESLTRQLTASPFLQRSPCYNRISDVTTDSQSLFTAEPLLGLMTSQFVVLRSWDVLSWGTLSVQIHTRRAYWISACVGHSPLSAFFRLFVQRVVIKHGR